MEQNHIGCWLILYSFDGNENETWFLRQQQAILPAIIVCIQESTMLLMINDSSYFFPIQFTFREVTKCQCIDKC